MELREDILLLMDAMPMGVHLIDTNATVRMVNRAWLMQFGRSFDDVLGKQLSDVMHDLIFFNAGPYRVDDPWELMEPAALSVLETGRPATASYNRGQCTAIARPIYSEEGKLQYVMTSYIDHRRGNDYALISTDSDFPNEKMLGQSEAMRQISEILDLISTSDVSVLMMGDTGTGKEVAADELVRRSQRHNKPFVKINCAAIPETLIEAELFGYEKGAFTGALKTGKIGLLEAANEGTVLLDEIGEMPMSMQPKLLRAIQERTITRVGGTESIPIDIRIIATTNRDLGVMVREGKFREDLYYRLNVIPIRIPRLRDREGDVRLILESFLAKFGEKYNRYATICEEGWEFLERYAWPGNIRQLRNFAERITILRGNRMVLLPDIRLLLLENMEREECGAEESTVCAVAGDLDTGSLQDATDRLQGKMIRDALARYRTTYQAAEALGISQPTLVRKAKKLGITGAEDEDE